MVRFVVFSDLHYEHIFDGDRRIDELTNYMKMVSADFAVSLGDLCAPVRENEKILNKLSLIGIPVYHVIGNHDSDSYTQEKIMSFLSLGELNYSFTYEGIKFIVLNSCYMLKDGIEYPYYKRNYEKKADCYPIIPEKEIKWLIKEMSDKKYRYVIFSQHSLSNEFGNRGVFNRRDVREILKSHNTLLCMNGHDHGDDVRIIDNIPYYTVNSASYIWHGMKEVYSYSKEIHERYPYLKDMLLYEQALCALVEIDSNNVNITGMEGDYLSETPGDVGIYDYKWNGVSIRPVTSSFVK